MLGELMEKYDVVALGELLIDFIQTGTTDNNNPLLEANPGGAPANVCSMLANLKHSCAYISKVGNDGFGKFLKKTLKEHNINDDCVYYDDLLATSLAIVTKDELGDRQFSFYRNPGADENIKEEEIKEDLINNCKIFHFGTISCTNSVCAKATLKALKIAKDNNKLISFDPNVRFNLWKREEDIFKYCDLGLKNCDILKIADNEIKWFSKIDDYELAIKYIKDKYPNIKLIVLTKGINGSCAYMNNLSVYQQAYTNKTTVDTTGCGDCFMGCVLDYILNNGLNLNEDQLKEMLKLASIASSILATRKGAFKAMPLKEEIYAEISKIR